MLPSILLVFAFVLALIRALMSPPSDSFWSKIELGWLSFAFYLASILVVSF